MALPSGPCPHLGNHVGPRMVLERQRFLCSAGIHPIDDEPVVVAVGIAGPAVRQHAVHAIRSREGPAYFGLPQLVRVVARDQQDLTDDVRSCGCRERRCDVTHVDAMKSSVDGQCAFDVRRIGADWHR